MENTKKRIAAIDERRIKMDRKPISKKLRFEVFKRDNFTCQYCGRMAPYVILEVDHIKPVCKGGENDILNLITSCKDCNMGKGKSKLCENDVLKKTRENLKEISIRKQQIEMMMQWKEELNSIEDYQVSEIETILKMCCDLQLSDQCKSYLKKCIKKYGFEEVYTSSEIYVEQYYDIFDESFSKTFDFIGRICETRRRQKNDPTVYLKNKLVYMIQKRFYYKSKQQIYALIDDNLKTKDQFEHLINSFKSIYTWGDLREEIESVKSW